MSILQPRSPRRHRREVTYCNSISVAEHVVMMILSLVRNYLPTTIGYAKAAEHRDCARAPTMSKACRWHRPLAGRMGWPCCAG